MLLAIHMEKLPRDGHVKDQADLAKLAGVTRAWVTQVMGRLGLAPEIQMTLLFAETTMLANRVAERAVRPVAALADWKRQLRLWSSILWAMT